MKNLIFLLLMPYYKMVEIVAEVHLRLYRAGRFAWLKHKGLKATKNPFAGTNVRVFNPQYMTIQGGRK